MVISAVIVLDSALSVSVGVLCVCYVFVAVCTVSPALLEQFNAVDILFNIPFVLVKGQRSLRYEFLYQHRVGDLLCY